MIKSMSQPLSSPAHIPHLDGIRGIAVLIILLFHLDFSLVGGGFIGVDVFLFFLATSLQGLFLEILMLETFRFPVFTREGYAEYFPPSL